METSAAAAETHFPIYISSDEEDGLEFRGASYGPEDIQMQQVVHPTTGSSGAPAAIPSSSVPSFSRASGVEIYQGTAKESLIGRKGKGKLSSEETHPVIIIEEGDERLISLKGATRKRNSKKKKPCNDVLQQVIVVEEDGGSRSFISVKGMDNGNGKKLGGNDVRQQVIIVGEDDVGLTSTREPGQCSRGGGGTARNKFYCTICMDTVPDKKRFSIAGCTHAFCVSCVEQYIAAKVEENVLSIGCLDPGCKDGALHPEAFRYVIRQTLFDRWGAALCDSALGALKFYCPFKDCSALLVDDPGAGDAAVAKVQCPHCRRTFCAQCKVPWHEGVVCAEFQRLGQDERGREDLLLRKVAHESKWQRCPKCKMYVERADGCVYIVCRCGHRFCYLCASLMVKGNHHCNSCKRTW